MGTKAVPRPLAWLSGILLALAVSWSLVAVPVLWGESRLIQYFLPSAPASFQCESPGYTVRVISYDPFIAHFEGFVTTSESQEITELATPHLNISRTERRNSSGLVKEVSKARNSQTAELSTAEPVIQCIAERAASFQGHLPVDGIKVQATFYGPGGFFRPHDDAGSRDDPVTFLSDEGLLHRVSTVFAILDADCDKCGTQFPLLSINGSAVDARMCELIDCEEKTLTVKARKGSALFWRNRFNNNSIDPRLLHAGLPLERGMKHGLNIWTSILKDPPSSQSHLKKTDETQLVENAKI